MIGLQKDRELNIPAKFFQGVDDLRFCVKRKRFIFGAVESPNGTSFRSQIEAVRILL